jgi:hypothetical protein
VFDENSVALRLKRQPLGRCVLDRIKVSASALLNHSEVTERAEYRHVVPGHPPLCNLSALDAEHRSEIKCRFGARREERDQLVPFACPRRSPMRLRDSPSATKCVTV